MQSPGLCSLCGWWNPSSCSATCRSQLKHVEISAMWISLTFAWRHQASCSTSLSSGFCELYINIETEYHLYTYSGRASVSYAFGGIEAKSLSFYLSGNLSETKWMEPRLVFHFYCKSLLNIRWNRTFYVAPELVFIHNDNNIVPISGLYLLHHYHCYSLSNLAVFCCLYYNKKVDYRKQWIQKDWREWFMKNTTFFQKIYQDDLWSQLIWYDFYKN